MTTRLISGKPLSSEFPRVLSQEIDNAISRLSNLTKPEEQRVHATRRHLKRIRSILRILRSEIGEKCFEAEKTWFASIARELSSARDKEVLVSTLRKLVVSAAPSQKGILKPQLSRFKKDTARKGQALLLPLPKLQLTLAQLEIGKKRLQAWPLLSDKVAPYLKGFKNTFKSGKKSFTRALKTPSTEILHKWRRDIKHLDFQLALQPKYTKTAKKEMKTLDKLGSVLGDYHDLVLVEEALNTDLQRTFSPQGIRILKRNLASEKARLVGKAQRLGKRVFSYKESAFAKRYKHKLFPAT